MIPEKSFISFIILFTSLSAFAGVKEIGNGGEAGFSKIIHCSPENRDAFPEVLIRGSEPSSNGELVQATLVLGTSTAETQSIPLKYSVVRPSPEERTSCGGYCPDYYETFKLLFKDGSKFEAHIGYPSFDLQEPGNGQLIVNGKTTVLKCTTQTGYGN